MKTEVFDRFLLCTDEAFADSITIGDIEIAFSEEERKELDIWFMNLYTLMRTYDGVIEDMFEEDQQRKQQNPLFEEDFQRTCHLQNILDESPSRLVRFEELVSTFIEKTVHDIMKNKRKP